MREMMQESFLDRGSSPSRFLGRVKRDLGKMAESVYSGKRAIGQILKDFRISEKFEKDSGHTQSLENAGEAQYQKWLVDRKISKDCPTDMERGALVDRFPIENQQIPDAKISQSQPRVVSLFSNHSPADKRGAFDA